MYTPCLWLVPPALLPFMSCFGIYCHAFVWLSIIYLSFLTLPSTPLLYSTVAFAVLGQAPKTLWLLLVCCCHSLKPSSDTEIRPTLLLLLTAMLIQLFSHHVSNHSLDIWYNLLLQIRNVWLVLRSVQYSSTLNDRALRSASFHGSLLSVSTMFSHSHLTLQ